MRSDSEDGSLGYRIRRTVIPEDGSERAARICLQANPDSVRFRSHQERHRVEHTGAMHGGLKTDQGVFVCPRVLRVIMAMQRSLDVASMAGVGVVVMVLKCDVQRHHRQTRGRQHESRKGRRGNKVKDPPHQVRVAK